ncbi:uncharacterized protein LOC122756890 [Drosophila mojavensis]|uniref:uncharacterized protein LOC122756889 n=1 Tax=Drosophila mojavensis TaxID=7230 RepID=UPI001CD0E4D3|nr:uncharacterized protein LOC122756889 [Drosophila mojavensis]XP_043863641.1 uncharacterized protein LOC122756890 [Drosophila mojavensis]
MLYGRRKKIVNLLLQVSRIAPYSGVYRVQSTAHLVDVARGIIGHLKKLCNILLNLNWLAVREEHYSLENDSCHILRQPHLEVPIINELKVRKMSELYEHLLCLHRIDRLMSAYVDVNIFEKYFKAVTKHR